MIKINTNAIYNVLLALIIVLVFGLMLSACKKTNNKNILSEHYDVIDSGLISGGDSINWMDNNRIILRAVDPNKPSKGKIYIWAINSNETIEYSRGGMPCYYDGYVFYAYKTDLNLTSEKPYGASWKEGQFKNEKLFSRIHRKGEGRKWNLENVRNKFNCRLTKRPIGMENHIWTPLLEEHGYLEFGRRIFDNNKDSVFLHKPDGNKIELPFKRGMILSDDGEYAAYKKAYFYWELVTSKEQIDKWVETGCSIGWWIYPEKEGSESVCIPNTPWKLSYIVKPTIKGLFLVSDNYAGNNPRDSGGYLYINKQFQKVIKGQIRNVKVSPDGCNIAMTHKLRGHTDLKEKMTLKVINICNDKE